MSQPKRKMGTRNHLLMPKEIAKKIPAMNAQEEVDDPIVYVKFFTPYSDWTWYATEYDEEDGMFFGYVNGFGGEWGEFFLIELEEATVDICGILVPAVERDCCFRPQPISELEEGAV